MICAKKPPCQFGQVDLNLPMWLGSQFGPCHFDWESDW
jgi:hypothetical protein